MNAIENPLSSQTIEWLGCSSIRTFEPFPADFNFAEGRALFDQFVGMLARTGKSAPTFHLPWGVPLDLSSINERVRLGAIEGVRRLFPMARILGSKILIEHPSYEPIPQEERERRIEKLRKSLHELQPLLRAEGVRMAIELLPRTCLGNTGEELMRIVGDCDDTIGVCLDVNHLMGRIKSLPDEVRLLGKRLIALHISDYMGANECHSMPGAGAIDWEPFIEALNEIGYQGDFNYETTITMAPDEQIAEIERNFKNIFLPLIQKEP